MGHIARSAGLTPDEFRALLLAPMKSSKVRLEEIAEPDNLREAFLRAARGKGHRADAIVIRENLDAELAALRAEILAGTVAVGNFTAFPRHARRRAVDAHCCRV